MEHKEVVSSHELKSKRLSRIIKEECASDNSETNDESSMSLSELKVKLNPDDNTSVNEWKSRFSDEYSSNKTLSPSAMSSDASSVHSGRFDSEYSVGQRIEVKDYRTDTWYLAKIVEVDYEDREIFIHYERWSQRFDEWLKWDSQRIRKVRLTPSPHRFKMGEHVLATWNYTKKYPAVIKTVYQDDKYEVLFYDGFAKILKGNRISKIDPQEVDLLEKMPKEIPRAPPIGADLDVRNIGTKEERRQKKRRLNVVELLQSNKRKKGDEIMSSQSCSDTSPEPVARRRYRQRRQLSQPSTSTDKRTSGYTETPKRRNSSVKADENTQSNQELVSVKMEMDDDAIEEKIENDEKSSVLKSDTSISTTVKDNVKDADVKNVNQSIKSEETDEANSSIEKDKDSNSELEFTGFETSPLTIKPKDFEQIRSSIGNPIDTSSPVIKDTNDNNENIESVVVSPVARRISKRGRIPKLKTSLGNLSTTPRLSAFPKIKPRGQIYKTDVKSNRNRFGRKSNASTSDNEMVSTNSSQISSTVNTSLDSSDKVDNDNVANNDTVGSVNRDNRFSNDTPVNESAMNIGDKGLDNSFGNEDAFSSTSSVAGSVNRRKGRRMKKSMKKLDIKKGKSWKIMSSRRKTDEDDDPERWSGDIPEGAKPVFIDGGDGKMRQSIIIPDKKLPPGWTKHTIIRKNSSKWDVLLVKPNKKRDSRKSGSDDSFTLSPSQVVIPDGEKRVKTLMPKTKPPVNTNTEEEPSTPSVATAIPTSVPIATTSTSLSNLNTQPLSPISAKSIPVTTPLTPKVPNEVVPVSGIGSPLTPDSDGTASWICPKEGCGKHFRKENLLQMHFKHYHPEYNQFLEGAPNVADLAYARTVGEPLDDTIGVTSFLDRIKIYEARRKAKTDKTNVAGSPLRKALLKGFPTSKESPEHSDCGDIVMKIDTSPGPLQNKLTDSSEQNGLISSGGVGGGGDAERLLLESPEKGKLQNGVEDQEKVYNDISSNHPTLKELLTGGPSIDESAPNSPATPITSSLKHVISNPSSYRFSRIKPFVSVEKLNVTTDSNGRVLYMDKKVREITKLTEKQADSLPDIPEHDLSADVPNCAEAEPDDMLKKEEIINCLCGYAEEDGLMIQCDLCLCWQHGFCNNIKKESDVPEKYICSICRNPKKLRNSYKYSYNFDWLKEGKLPNLSFRTQNKNEIQQRESLLKRSHDLVATLLQLQTVVKSLRLKTHIAGKSDHPKLYLWAKSWEKETKADAKVKIEDKGIGDGDDDKKEIEIKKEKENVEDTTPKGPQAPVPEAPIDLVECRLRLLEHIEDYQQQVESRLTTIEAQVVALESQDSDVATDETPDDYSQTKQTVQMLMRDLGTVRKVIGLN